MRLMGRQFGTHPRRCHHRQWHASVAVAEEAPNEEHSGVPSANPENVIVLARATAVAMPNQAAVAHEVASWTEAARWLLFSDAVAAADKGRLSWPA